MTTQPTTLNDSSVKPDSERLKKVLEDVRRMSMYVGSLRHKDPELSLLYQQMRNLVRYLET